MTSELQAAAARLVRDISDLLLTASLSELEKQELTCYLGEAKQFFTGNIDPDRLDHVYNKVVAIKLELDLALLNPETEKLQRGDRPFAELRSMPPALGEALLALLCPKNRVDAVMGDLEERFHEHVGSKGERRAKLLYWAGVLRSIGPLFWVKLRKAGLIALLLEIGRRWSALS